MNEPVTPDDVIREMNACAQQAIEVLTTVEEALENKGYAMYAASVGRMKYSVETALVQAVNELTRPHDPQQEVCTCHIGPPDSDGNRDMDESPDCPIHG